ncbi:MAG: hypothetical protein ACLUQ6_13125 [Alistipes onderdonkii]
MRPSWVSSRFRRTGQCAARGAGAVPRAGRPDAPTELRILAVMRLGITDSGRIAGFLNCASATVYTYRTKLRNSALGSRSDFETRIKHIGL